MAFRRFINGLIKLLAWLFLVRVRVTGLENLPPSGPLIIMINHINFLDGPLALAYIPRDKIAMTKAETFQHPILGPLSRWYGIFGVRRGEVDRAALRLANNALRSGMALLYSPEGHRSGHGRLQQAKNGIAFIASRAGAVVVPVAISGGEAFRRNIKRLRTTPVDITIGRAFRFRSQLEGARNHVLDEMTSQAVYQLASLLPERYRGHYADLSLASDNHLEFVTTES